MKIWLCVVSILLCAHAAWAQPPEDSPPYPETGPGHAQLAVLEAGASNFALHSATSICPFGSNKTWVRTRYEMALMTALAMETFYPQLQLGLRSDRLLLLQRLHHLPAMATALSQLVREFTPELSQFGFKPNQIALVEKELSAHGANARQQYSNVPLDDQAYADVQLLRRTGLAPLHSGQRNFDDGSVMSRYEFAIVVARIIQAGTPKKEERSSLLEQKTSEWFLPLNGFHVKSTAEVKAVLARLIQRFTPELNDLGFASERLAVVQRELLAGDTSGSLKVGATQAFSDVPPAHWAFSAVERLRINGILLGDGPR